MRKALTGGRLIKRTRRTPASSPATLTSLERTRELGDIDKIEVLELAADMPFCGIARMAGGYEWNVHDGSSECQWGWGIVLTFTRLVFILVIYCGCLVHHKVTAVAQLSLAVVRRVKRGSDNRSCDSNPLTIGVLRPSLRPQHDHNHRDSERGP
jgi:hypothetical protein